MPSVASEINAAQQSRFHHSQPRGRAEANDGAQSSPFADMLDSATPPSDQTPAAHTARSDRSDDSRPAGQDRQPNARADRNSTNDAKSPSDNSSPANAKDAKDTEANASVNVTAEVNVNAKGAVAGKDGDKTGKTDDSNPAPADADSDTKAGDGATVAMPAVVDAAQQPVAVAADPNVVAPQPLVTDAAQSDAATSGKAAQTDALAGLQAAVQNAATANAGAADPAAATDDAKGKGKAAPNDDIKGDGKKDAKADAKGDAKVDTKGGTKALAQAKSDAISDTRIAAAQSQSDSDDVSGQQGGDQPADVSHHSAAKPAPDVNEADTRGRRATPAADAAKTAAVQVQNAQAAANAAAADAAASAPATATAAASGATTNQTQAPTPSSTQFHAQLQLGTDNSAAFQVSALPVEIASRAVAGKRQFEIRLDPPELGRVDVKVDIDKNGNATTRLVVDKAETLDLLKRDSQQLERALQQAGLKTSDNGLEFSLRQQSAQSDDQGSFKGTTVMVPDEDTTPLPVQRQGYGRLLGMSGGLDIRV
ncbi:flagellar hook-length control protein FliK [Rhodoplanes sp. Z2-YC6860]|uniref:flagellar hook-length control protein FliK n=1 Tax=Rhodoplanes sp. Z2-YC6860 TaxID=674703 RepID=UPI00078E54B4|nr:flagellar hook-length control protein FliK [Rhodoplanes sp. Z2-YC6860]AMN44291.1 flagellar hook-length control protein [Rhodoplanes sp. Z2-YC6860]